MPVSEAVHKLSQIVRAIKNPDLERAGTLGVATTDLLGAQQNQLLEGRGETSGLLSAQAALEKGDVALTCRTLAGVLREILVNKVLLADGTDAISLQDPETRAHDPEQLFLEEDDARVQWLFGPQLRTRSLDRMRPPVVSAIWEDVTLSTIDLVYALGPTCVDHARPSSDTKYKDDAE